jgi:hypothetical protein
MLLEPSGLVRLIDCYRIRNYMSKPWFLEMTMQAEPSQLAGRIQQILKPMKSELMRRNGEEVAREIKDNMRQGM